MTEIAARIARPIQRLGTFGAVGILLALIVAAGGSALLARAIALRDAVLPGVEVAGVDVGGLAPADARAKVAAVIGERLALPVEVTVGGETFSTLPAELFELDPAATERLAFEAARRSFGGRVAALALPFAVTSVDPVLRVRPEGRAALSRELLARTDRPVSARVSMNGMDPIVVPARAGTQVDEEAVLTAVRAAALTGAQSLQASVSVLEPELSTADAERAAATARTAVAAPVKLRLKKKRLGELETPKLAKLIRFQPASGAYEVRLDGAGLGAALGPLVRPFLEKPVDADFRIVGRRVRVIRSKNGTKLALAQAQEAVLGAAVEPGVRVAIIELAKRRPGFTTREAKALGIRHQISTYTTDMGVSSSNRIWNVHLLGRYLDGTIVKPKQWFSYNKVMGPRTVERGFREGQMIFNGVLVPAIGGGVCQTGTTIFNAAFEAGLPIKERHNHSFYISHYPLGRDATVSWGGPDLVFRNDLKNAILIKVRYTNETFTVTFYGTKQRRKVVSTTSSPTNYTQPRLQYAIDSSAPAGSVRTAGGGGPGFDVNVHRKVYERGKLIRKDDFFTRYTPQNRTAIYGPGRAPPGPFFYLPSGA